MGGVSPDPPEDPGIRETKQWDRPPEAESMGKMSTLGSSRRCPNVPSPNERNHAAQVPRVPMEEKLALVSLIKRRRRSKRQAAHQNEQAAAPRPRPRCGPWMPVRGGRRGVGPPASWPPGAR